ncbi:MAG: alkaline phosphatase family protein [Gemmataceae bacterium]|nr:alkaline phosphatase family protein [Gemmataceae bacterium]
MPPVVLVNAVGLTRRLLVHAPRLQALAQQGWLADMPEVIPAVTCTAQATLLTGTLPEVHGVVANGWLYRETQEVRFWQQCNRLIQAEPLYVTFRRFASQRGRTATVAKLFWWFNQGAAVDISVTPKPHYGIDGDKVFGITGTPKGLPEELEQLLGPFPFAQFWGPLAGLASTAWIAQAAAIVLERYRPMLTLVYLPHLDYDPQRFGPSGCDIVRCVRELDDACAPLLDAASRVGAQVWVVSEYGHVDVRQPVYPNRLLRQAGLLEVRHGPFGEQLDLYASRAFAVVDHQIAHIYVRDPEDVPRVCELFASCPDVAEILNGEERARYHLQHSRSGEVILLAQPHAWFAYPFWLDEANAPDYARCVAIHHKPGFDPCELFFDPKLRWPKLVMARKLLAKKLGWRVRFDVIPLNAEVVHGSHGLPAADPIDRPILIGHGPCPGSSVAMTAVRSLILQALDCTLS